MNIVDVVDNLLLGISALVFILWFFQWFIHVVAIIYGKCKLHSCAPGRPVEDGIPLPGVSVIKPLIGVDSNLFNNLETFFNMDYPKYELLFCVESDSDPAIMVVQSLLAKYPNVDSKLFIGASKVGINPKINNMMEAYNASKYEFLLISDSGLRMKPDSLSHMAASFGETTGLVHQMPFTCDREGFASVLEKVYFGTQHAKMYISADMYGINCVTGMSTLFRKDVLEKAGGLRGLSGYLAEDFYLGQVFIDRGWKVQICCEPGLQNSGSCSVPLFQARMMRWMKLRMSLIPFTAIVLEPISECFLSGVTVSLAVTVLFHWSGLAFFLVHSLIWFLLDYLLLIVVQGGPLPFTKLEFVSGWVFRELTSFPLMLKAHMTNTLTWRAKQYIVRAGGVGVEVYPTTQSVV